MSYIRIIERK